MSSDERPDPPRSVLLFSGGLDSTVLLAHALDEGATVHVVEIDYPGRPAGERAAASKILSHYSIDDAIQVRMPTADDESVVRRASDAEGFVPLRNLWFHTTAALLARQTGATRVLVGHLDQDALDFPDARPDYFDRIEELVNEARLPNEPRAHIERPFEGRSKLYVARLGRRLEAPLDVTWSCYRDGPVPCGECTGCRERKVVLEAAT